MGSSVRIDVRQYNDERQSVKPKGLRDQLVRAAPRGVVVRDRDHDRLVGAVLGRDVLDPGLDHVRRSDDRAPARDAVEIVLGEEAQRALDARHRRQAAGAQVRRSAQAMRMLAGEHRLGIGAGRRSGRRRGC
jgi:nitroreductase